MEAGTIVLDKERHMRLTRYGQDRYNEATGKEISDFEADVKADRNLFYAAIWAYLVWEDEKLTIPQVKDMVSKFP